jgi:hypothetical protein
MISVMQTANVAPSFVAADGDLTLSLTRAPTSTEPLIATGTVEIHANGQVNVHISHATPNSAYDVLIVSGTSTSDLGTIVTGNDGEGQLQATLSSGTYIGIVELVRTGVVQFVSATTSITVGVTASASISATTSQTSQTTQSQTVSQTTASETTESETHGNSTLTGSAQVQLQVDPSFASVTAGSYTKFEIHISAAAGSSVYLAVRGVPSQSLGLFTQVTGFANPEFHSALTVATSANTPQGTYGLTVVAVVNGQEFDSQMGLQVTSTTSQTISGSVTAGLGLVLSLDTNQHVYSPNATVTVEGHVTDNSGSAIAGANVAIQVDASTGTEISSANNVQTDTTGAFLLSFQLPSTASTGTYTVFASASVPGYASATTHTTFVLGSSSAPSVVIKAVYAGDSSGNPTTVFSSGQTVYIWVTVQNIGSTINGAVIWVQIRDPNGVPVSIQIRISTLNSGDTVTDAFGFTFLGPATPGPYSVNALVSDKLISQGGTFLASANAEFAVSG